MPPPPFAGSPPPGMLPQGMTLFPPGVRPPFPPPFLPPGMPLPGAPPTAFSPPPGMFPPGVHVPPIPGASPISPPPGVPGAPPPGAPAFVPAIAPPSQTIQPTYDQQQHQHQHQHQQQPQQQQQAQQPVSTVPPTPLVLPDPSLAQVNPTFKKATVLKWSDANFSPVRCCTPLSLFSLSDHSSGGDTVQKP